jgi:hypothetical protein
MGTAQGREQAAERREAKVDNRGQTAKNRE